MSRPISRSSLASSGEVWFHRLKGANGVLDPFASPMATMGAVGSTIGLLDGAINLGFSGIENRLARPDLTLAGYIVALVGAYHTSIDTPRNLRRAAERFIKLGRAEVAVYLEERAREETGHDRLALKDLRALGVPAERLVANFIPEGIKPLCERFDSICTEDYPIGSIGYSYCLERIAALKQKADIQNVQAICPDGVDATRFLRSHSSLGSEVAHVDETIKFVASLPANDRIKSFRRRISRHRSWPRDIITSSSNPRGKYSMRFNRRSERCSRIVTVLIVGHNKRRAIPTLQ